jgi:hypothetical protein
MDDSAAIPDFLTHYYKRTSRPFRTLSDLSVEEVEAVIGRLQESGPLPFRLTQQQYMIKRRNIERIMRRAFVQKGGRPRRENPHYMVLGSFSLWETSEFEAVRIPLDHFASKIISFTFTDSFYAFERTSLHGKAIPPRPYHRQVFRREELPSLIDEYGLHAEKWKCDPQAEFDVYIEAQIWSDAPLKQYLRPESVDA